MNLLVPGALAVLSLAIPLTVLYMLRSRRMPMDVSSTMLWERTGPSVSSAVPWQKLRITPLLLLQLLLLAAFALSLARPFFTQATLLGPHTVLVFDTSGSMAMEGRFDRAVREARELAASTSVTNLVSVVEAGPRARVVRAFAQTEEAVVEALEELTVTGGAGDLSAAIALARGLATPDRPTGLVLFSDGGIAPLAEEPVVGAVQVGFVESSDNLTVESLTADPSGEGVVRLFVSVGNHTGRNREVTLDIMVGGIPAGSVELPIDPLSTNGRTFPVDAEPGDEISVAIRHDAQGDGNPLDDRAWVVLSSAPERTVSVTGRGSTFIDALIEVAPGFRVAPGEGDLSIVDGGALPATIDEPTWLIATDPPPDSLTFTELVQNAVATYQRPGEPILDGVDLSELVVAEAQVVDGNTWVPLVRAGDAPLVLLGEIDGQRVVYQTFDLAASNLPVQLAFPILGTRLLEWLGGTGAGSVSTAPAGDPIPITTPPGAEAIVTTPGGTAITLDQRATAFDRTGTPGVYRVAYQTTDGGTQPGPIAVRSFDPVESSTPARQITTTPAAGAAEEDSTVLEEWAPWIVGLVLILMLIEWWVGHRRPLPGIRQAAAA